MIIFFSIYVFLGICSSIFVFNLMRWYYKNGYSRREKGFGDIMGPTIVFGVFWPIMIVLLIICFIQYYRECL